MNTSHLIDLYKDRDYISDAYSYYRSGRVKKITKITDKMLIRSKEIISSHKPSTCKDPNQFYSPRIVILLKKKHFEANMYYYVT